MMHNLLNHRTFPRLASAALILGMAPPIHGQADSANDLVALSDEFERPEALASWSGFAGSDQQLDIGENRKGWLTLHASGNKPQPLLYREVEGDFTVSARISPGKRESDKAQATLPGFAGLIINNAGKHYSIAFGEESGTHGFAVNTDGARPQVVDAKTDTGEVQVARVGDSLITLVRENGGQWMVQGRTVVPNLPETLQVGLTAYSHSAQPAAAQVDWVRFRSLTIPEGVDAGSISDATQVTDEGLLGFLGKSVLRPVPGDVRTWRWNVADPVPFKGVEHGEIWSSSMQRMVGYNIYLPPSYHTDSERRYPVIYWLHGASGDESGDVAMTHLLDDAIRAGTAAEAIMVVPNSGQYSGYRDWEQGGVKSETWIINELIPTIDERYRTIADGDARGIGGFSMGGAGSTRFVGKYPEMFCALVSFSAGVGPDGPPSGPNPRPVGNSDTFGLYEKNAETIKERYDIYFAVGGTDRAYARHPDFLAHLYKLGIAFHYEVHPNIGHHLGHMTHLSGAEMIKTFDTAFKRTREANSDN